MAWLKMPTFANSARSSTCSPMATPNRLPACSLREKTPYGKFCSGKWQVSRQGMNDMLPEQCCRTVQVNISNVVNAVVLPSHAHVMTCSHLSRFLDMPNLGSL